MINPPRAPYALAAPEHVDLTTALEICRLEVLSCARYLRNVDAVNEAVAQLDLSVLGMADPKFDPRWPLMTAASIASARRFPGQLTIDLLVRWDDAMRPCVHVLGGDDRATSLLGMVLLGTGWTLADAAADEPDAGRAVRFDSEELDVLGPTLVTGAEDALDAGEHRALVVPDPMSRLQALVDRTTPSRFGDDRAVGANPLSQDSFVAAWSGDALWEKLASRIAPIALEALVVGGVPRPVHDVTLSELREARQSADSLYRCLLSEGDG